MIDLYSYKVRTLLEALIMGDSPQFTHEKYRANQHNIADQLQICVLNKENSLEKAYYPVKDVQKIQLSKYNHVSLSTGEPEILNSLYFIEG